MKAWLAKRRQKQSLQIRDKINFMKKLSELLAEGYQFSEAIIVLLPHHVTDVSSATAQILEQLREGHGVVVIMKAFHIAPHHLIALTIAEQNGEMVEAFAKVAQRIAVEERLKQQLKQAMLYPATLLTLLFFMFLLFRTLFFPRIAAITTSRQVEGGPTFTNYQRLLYLPDFFLALFLFVSVLLFVSIYYIKRQPVAKQLKIQHRIIIWRTINQRRLTQQFAGHLGALLHAGIALQDSLFILRQQTYHQYIRYIATTTHEQVLQGTPLLTVVALNDYLSPQLQTFIAHGETSGFLSKELLIYSELVEDRMIKSIERLISAVQPLLFVIVALCIVAAYVSLLVPIYSMMKF